MAAGALLNQGDRTKLPLKGGIMQGIINMNGNAIKNLPNATDPNDPVTKAQYDSDAHITWSNVLNDLYNTKKLRKNTYSDGHAEFVSDVVGIGGSQNNLLGYAESVFNAGYQGVVNVQLYEGANAPSSYCPAQIIIGGTRMVVIIWGLSVAIYRNAYVVESDGSASWRGWYKFTGTLER